MIVRGWSKDFVGRMKGLFIDGGVRRRYREKGGIEGGLFLVLE